MELIWSNDGVSTLLLPAKILLFPEEKEIKSTKKVKTLKEVLFADFPKYVFLSYLGEICGWIYSISMFILSREMEKCV